MLDVRRMRVLREVARQGSFSAAADALSFTQSAISQQVAALEREAGAVLVERSARGVRLTDAGRAVVAHADAILARLAEAEAELEAIAGLRGGRLRMAAFESAGSSFMPLAIARFRAAHPEVELSLQLLEPEDALPLLRSGDLEIVLDFDVVGVDAKVPHPADQSGIERRFLLDDPLRIVLRRDHPLVDKPRLLLKDLAEEVWVMPPQSCHCARLCLLACQAAGFEPRMAFESDDYLAVQGFVAAGVGCALIPELGLTTVRDDIVVRELPAARPPARRLYASVAQTAYGSPAAAAMLDLLEHAAQEFVASRQPVALAA